jgi:hypothetical protein
LAKIGLFLVRDSSPRRLLPNDEIPPLDFSNTHRT